VTRRIVPVRPGLVAASATLLVPGLLVGAAGTIHASVPSGAPSASVDYVNVSATGNYQFQPALLYVAPGAVVHLAVTQLAAFSHTFTLSSVANVSIPTSLDPAELYQYFQTHAPILNLSLGSVVGVVTTATFTAPAAGTYEFVCTEPGHFQSGMKGFLNSTTTAPSSGAAPASPVVYYVAIGVASVVVAILAVIALTRRPKRPSPAAAGPSPPAT